MTLEELLDLTVQMKDFTVKSCKTYTGHLWSVKKLWYALVGFSSRKIAFDGNAPAGGSTRRIKWGDDLWQVHPGALPLDAHVLSPETVEITPSPKDERRHDFWQVEPHAQ